MQIIKLKKTRSTQDYIKKLVKKQRNTREDLFVVSAQQTGGKGRKAGRFHQTRAAFICLIYTFTRAKRLLARLRLIK